jgi:hypothetical protein
MSIPQLDCLFDVYDTQQAEDIVKAALSSPAYKLRMRVAVVCLIFVAMAPSFLVHHAIHVYKPDVYVRLFVVLIYVLWMFFCFKLIYPVNDKLVGQAILKELARRSSP